MKRSYRDYGAAFAKILVPLRERKGVTQEQLARRSKVPLRVPAHDGQDSGAMADSVPAA